MDPLALLLIVAVLIIGLVGGFVWLRRSMANPEDGSDRILLEENAQLKALLSQKDRSIGELTTALQNEKTERDQLSGKNKQLFVEVTNLKAEGVNISNERERLVKEVSNLKATEDGRKKEFDQGIQKLDEAKTSLEEERQRVRRIDEEKLQKEQEERNRMWAEHEEKVKIQLTELCKIPQYAFQYYDNNNLPIGFGGRFKPDFLIEFLGQYVIFDAKVSESVSGLQNYINGAVKSTVEKINGDSRIYSTVFFVVPTEAMKSLSKIRFYEQSYDFFVIPPEAIEAVLASFKKISSYELAQQLDPRDRENIVNLIAEFDYHINMRNALDILASESGVSVLKKAEILQHDIKEEIVIKKNKMRLQQFTPTDIKTLMVKTEVQEERISDMISPKVAISKDNIKSVKPVLGKTKPRNEQG